MMLNINIFHSGMWVGFLAKLIDPWLSAKIIVILLSWENPISWSNFLNQIASLLTWVAAIYFDSVEDKATVFCNLLLQLITPLANINTNLPVDLLLSRLSPQLASVYSNNPIEKV